MMRADSPGEQSRAAREALLDAAVRLLGRHGYRKATLDDLAHEAGVARRSIYLHFASKEEIFLASIDRVVERLLAELRRIAADDSPASDRLWRMLVTRVMLRIDSVRGYHQSLDEMLADLRPHYLERREQYFAAEAEVIAKVVDQGRRIEGWAIDDSTEAARALVVATNALLPYSLTRRELGSRAEVQRDAAAVATLLMRGLQAPAARARGATRATR
jgi:AcrR family transcriptional regulator